MRKEDTIFGNRWLVLVGNRGQFPSICVARSIMLELLMQRPQLDGIFSPNRFGLVEDLLLIVFAKRISTLEYGGLSWLITVGNFPVFG
jgi:hypothetical protein